MAALPPSPLAVPLPDLAPLGGVRLGAAAAGIRYKGRTDLVMVELAAGTTVAGVFTRNKCPGAPIDWCRHRAGRRPGARPGRQCRQRQRVHRRARAGDDPGHRRRRGRPARLPGHRGLSGQHRASSASSSRTTASLRRCPALQATLDAGVRGRMAARGHHDHRHLSRKRPPAPPTIGGSGRPHHRHRQGQRHDRARHGDDALLPVHRRRDPVEPRCRRCWQPARRRSFNAHHGGQRHLHQRHGCCCLPPVLPATTHGQPRRLRRGA